MPKPPKTPMVATLRAVAMALGALALALPIALPADASAANRFLASPEPGKGAGGPDKPGAMVRMVAAASTLTVDSAFEDEYGFLVPRPFVLDLPDAGDGQVNVAYPDTVEGAYLRISFSTLADGLVEELDVIPLRIRAETASARRHLMSQLFITQVFADLTQRYINKSLEGVNIYALAGTHAVVLNGTYWDPGAGDIAVRIYGVMPSTGEDGLIFYERRYVDRAPDAARLSEKVVRSVRFR